MMTRLSIWLLMSVLLAATPATAQDHSSHRTPGAMNLFPDREISGTAWQPDLTPMSGFHGDVGGWTFMVHANVFAQYLYESGEVHRTSRQAGSINWFMGMLRRPAGRGRVGLRAMLSLEPWTIRGCGYPDLLATGEVCGGDSLHDTQHPHELFMELAADYERPLTDHLRLHGYVALAGEPALGPPGFPHRASAFPNPIAPISHHWLDSTHIAFGVVTGGISGRAWKAEASAFNGREPDAARTNLEFAALDSTAVRLSVQPTRRLAVQVSAGHLHESEEGLGSQPRQDVDRATVSVLYHRALGAQGLWATTLAYGANHETSVVPDGVVEGTTHAALVESRVTMPGGVHSWFGRFDLVGKPAHDLHVHEYITSVFTVGKLQIGYLRQLSPVKGWRPGIGAHLNLSVVPSLLAPRYGGRVIPGLGVYFNLQPALSAMPSSP